MRKWFMILFAVIALTGILITAAGAAVPEVKNVTLYNNSAFVYSETGLDTETGEVSVKLEIPWEIDSETIIVVDDGATIRQYSVEVEEAELEGLMLRMLNANKGKEVLLATEFFTVRGTVGMTVAKNYVLLTDASFVGLGVQLPGKTAFLPIYIINSISATETIEDLEEEQEYVKYLVVDETASIAERTIKTYYFVNGAGWKPVYNLFLDSEVSATMQYLTKATNNTNYDWNRVELAVVAGSPNMKSSYGYRYGYDDYYYAEKAAAPMAGGYEEEQYTSSELEEYHQYDLGRKVSIKKNSSAFIPLLTKSLVYSKIYEWYAESSTVQYKIEFKNTANEPFASGWVSAYDSGKYVGGDNMEWTAKGQKAELTIGKALDIEVEKKEDISTTTTAEYTRTHYKITLELENHKSTNVTVKVTDYIPSDAENLTYTVQPDKVEENEAEWNVNISTGGKKNIVYEYDRTYYNY